MSKYTTPVLRRGEIEMLVDTRDDPQAISSLCVLHNTESGTRSEPMPIQQAVKWGYWEPVKINLIEPTYLLSEHSGAMVALHIPEEVGKKLALDDGLSPEEMHVTLVYMGEADEQDQTNVESSLSEFSATHPPFTGRVGGIGRFAASKTSDGKDVIYASVDAGDLPAFRQDLVEALEGVVKLGSSKSGFYGHKGRPGKRGGSSLRISKVVTARDAKAILGNLNAAGLITGPVTGGAAYALHTGDFSKVGDIDILGPPPTNVQVETAKQLLGASYEPEYITHFYRADDASAMAFEYMTGLTLKGKPIEPPKTHTTIQGVPVVSLQYLVGAYQESNRPKDIEKLNVLTKLAEHGFTPHITLKYISPADPMPIERLEPLALMFDKIYLHWGDEVKEYTLDEGKR